MFVHNPPKKVLENLQSEFGDEIEYCKSEYAKLDIPRIKRIYNDLNKNILGQEKCKIEIISGLYRLTKEKSQKPAVSVLPTPDGPYNIKTAGF